MPTRLFCLIAHANKLDINKLLEKQIEDIRNSANAPKEGMSEDILLGVKGGHATQLL